jgi:hypothetical protein
MTFTSLDPARRVRRTGGLTVACFWALDGLAADGGGNYAVWGIGQASCNQYSQAYESKSLKEFINYLAGYLTAVNTLSEGVYQVTGQNTLGVNLDKLYAHCAQHRMDSFERAIQALVADSAQARAAAATEKATSWGKSPAAGGR